LLMRRFAMGNQTPTGGTKHSIYRRPIVPLALGS
jgi:hypothetical protein